MRHLNWLILPALIALTACGSKTKTTDLSSTGDSSPPEVGLDAPSEETPTKDAEKEEWVALSPKDALAHGIKFLLNDQNEDGSWGGFHTKRVFEIYLDNLSSHRAFHSATTALGLMAVYGESETNQQAKEATDKALNYLLTAEPPGRASGRTFYNTWAHTYMLQAMSMLHQDDRYLDQREDIGKIITRELETMRNLQTSSGGWGYYDFSAQLKQPSGAQSTSFNTGAAMMAFHEAKKAGFEADQDMIKGAIRCIEVLRLPSGAYIYGFGSRYAQNVGFNQVKGSLGRSQPCNLGLFTYEREITTDDLKLGLSNLREYHHFIEIGRGRQFPHEAWYSTAGYYYFFGHYYASRVIHELEKADQYEYAEWLAGVMAITQNPDGSWFDFPLYGYSKQYGCALAVMTLQHCLNAMENTEHVAFLEN